MPAKLLPLLKAEFLSGQNSDTGISLDDRKPLKSEIPDFKYTMKLSHSEFYCVTVWYYLLLRHYHLLPDTSILLQATERTAR